MNLLDLMVKVGIDDQATQKIGGIANGIKSGLGTAAKAGTAAVAAVGVAATGATAAFVGGASQVAEYGDNIDKMSQKMGLSAEAYQEWDAVMQHSGTSMETMKASMKTLANAVESGNEAFERIGLTQEQIASMNQEELFEATIAGLQNVDDETERTYLAGQLLGRGATELGALLNTSAEDTQAMRDRVHELGGVMSDEAVKASARFQDSLQDMTTAFGGMKLQLMSEFLPGMATVMDGLTDIMAGATDEGSQELVDGFGELAEKATAMVQEGLPVFADMLAQTLPVVAESVMTVLPTLLEAILGLIVAIGEGLPELIAMLVPIIVEMLPMFVDASVQLFTGLLDGLTEAMPSIVDGLTTVLVTLIEKLPEYLPQLIGAAIEFFMALLTAILEDAPQIAAALVVALGELIEYVREHRGEMLEAGLQLLGELLNAVVDSQNGFGQVITDLVDLGLQTLWDYVTDMWNMGGDLVQGLIDGIWANISGVGDALMGGLQSAVDDAKAFLGIASPSKLFKWIGEMSMEGLGEGYDKYMPDLPSMMADMTAPLTSGGGLALAGAAVQAAPTIVINIDGARVNDDARINQLFRDFMYELTRNGGM